MGYGSLARNGDSSLSFGIVNGDPRLSYADRNTGYGMAIEALNHAIQHMGFKTGTVTLQGLILELAQETKYDEEINTEISDIPSKFSTFL